MRTEHVSWNAQAGWSRASGTLADANLVLFFGGRAAFDQASYTADLGQRYPAAHLVGCSTGGQIVDGDVSDDTATAIAMRFDRTELAIAGAAIGEKQESFAVGRQLGEALNRPGLRAIFVLSDGLNVNGSQLVAGLRAVVGDQLTITGGLAGDGALFEHTVVHVDGHSGEHQVAAVGFYGDSLRVGHGSAGGWSEFGPKRLITKSTGNVLYEVDGQPALALYKLYLGEEAKGLPGTGLLYPLLVGDPRHPDHAVVRTILAVDEASGSMTFAGDVPEGANAQLMRGYFDRLSEAAAEAASAAMGAASASSADTAAILISCIGRRILMGESIVEEVSAAREALGPETTCSGFYSYGEISPHAVSGCAELHNQTMTVTTFSEAA